MRQLLLRRRGLSSPGLNPGFDQSHPIAKNCIVSAIAAPGGNFINILTGAAATPNTVVAVGGTKVRAFLGNAIGSDNSSGNQKLSFTGLPAPTAPYPATLAAVFTLTALHNNNQFVVENAFQAQLQLGILSNTFQLNRWGASNDSTGFTPIVGVPYFLACSTDNVNVTNFVWTRLDTGVIRSFKATPASGAVAGTTKVSSPSVSGGNAFDGFISEFMASQAVHDMPTMLAWAADSRGFWYPTPSSYVAFDSAFISGPISAGVVSVPTIRSVFVFP